MSEKSPLSAIELHGFRSIRELPKLTLSDGLNVLIGANGAGKSNFVNFFQMLRHMMDKNLGLQNFVAKGGGADALLFRGVETTETLSAKLWFDQGRYEFTLQVSDNGNLFFSKESIYFDNPNGQYHQGSGHPESKLVDMVIYSPDCNEQVPKPTVDQRFEHVRLIKQWTLKTLRSWRIYHFQNTSKTAAMMRSVNVVDNESLWPDAGNIAPFLLKMRDENTEYYDRIISHIRLAAPYFGDFIFKPQDANGQVQLLWKEQYSDKTYYPHQLSDGSIRFICLTALLLQPNPPSTIIIDEPELGLHPFAIRLLADMFRLAEEKCQLIVSTQSSTLVDHLELEDLIVTDRKNGETILTRPNKEALGKWLEDYSIGELWDKNILGGQPEP